MGKFILFFVLVGFLYISDVAAQPRGMDFGRFLMMRERAMAMRRAFPFGFPGSGIPPALAARLAAASGGGLFDPSFDIGPGIIPPFSPLGASLMGPGFGLGPMDTPFLGPPALDPSLVLRDSAPLGGGDSGLAAALGVDTSTLGGTATSAGTSTRVTESVTGGATPGRGFGPTPFGGTPSGRGGPTGFGGVSFGGTSTGTGGPTGFGGVSFGGSSTGTGGRFPAQAFGGAQRRPGQLTPPPQFRRRIPPGPPSRRTLRDPRVRRPIMFPRSIPRRGFPQIPQIPQIPAVTGQTSSTGGTQNSMTNPGSPTSMNAQSFTSMPAQSVSFNGRTSTSMNAQSFPSIPAQSVPFNGRTSEFSTETSPNAIFPSQTAQAPTVVSQRPTPQRIGSPGPRQETQGPHRFPEEPMIPQIPSIPSRSAPSRRAPNGMLQFANQGLNVRFSRLPPSMTGGRSQATQPSFTRRVGMRGIDFARLAGQSRRPAEQPGPAAGPAFVTGTDASQNMNIQFRPLTINQQGKPGTFDPSAVQAGFMPPSFQQGGQSSVSMGGASSVSQGSTFTVTKDASSSGPAEFQIVKVGSIPEFSGAMGNTVDVKMQEGQAVINGQTSSVAATVDTVAPAPQEGFQPVGDIIKANTAFGAMPGFAGSATDLTASISSGASVSTNLVADSSATETTSVDSSASTSSVTDQAAAMTGTETLKLKSPLEATDFSFFAESANIQPAANGQQPKEVITLTEAAVFEPPIVKTEISNTESKQANDFQYEEKVNRNTEMLKQVLLTPERLATLSGSTTLEFPVQGTAAKTPGVSASKDFTFTAPNSNIQTELSSAMLTEKLPGEAAMTSQADVSSSSNVIVEKMSTVDGSTSKDFSFFRPPALDIQPVVDNQIPTVNVQSLPTVSDPAVDSLVDTAIPKFQPPAVLDDTFPVDASLSNPAVDSLVDTAIPKVQPPALKVDTLPLDASLSSNKETEITSDVAPVV